MSEEDNDSKDYVDSTKVIANTLQAIIMGTAIVTLITATATIYQCSKSDSQYLSRDSTRVTEFINYKK